MDEFEIIEHTKNDKLKSGEQEIIAIAFLKPAFIKGVVTKDLKKGTNVSIMNDNILFGGKVVGRVTERKSSDDVNLDEKHDIKYTGGYSIDGKTIYLDEHFPHFLTVEGKQIDATKTIGLHHELPEKWMSDNAFEYPYAHEVATGIEKKYVESLGVTWKGYCEEVDKNLRNVYRQKLKDSPPSLDLSPYLYCRDREALKEIRKSEE